MLPGHQNHLDCSRQVLIVLGKCQINDACFALVQTTKSAWPLWDASRLLLTSTDMVVKVNGLFTHRHMGPSNLVQAGYSIGQTCAFWTLCQLLWKQVHLITFVRSLYSLQTIGIYSLSEHLLFWASLILGCSTVLQLPAFCSYASVVADIVWRSKNMATVAMN